MVSLDPGGVYLESRGLASDGVHQVGWARQGAGGGGNQHAALWTGSAATFTDLNPLGYYRSQSHGIDGDMQAGWAANLVDFHDNAMIWRGSHDAFTNLHPIHLPEYVDSYCLAAGGGIQAGYAYSGATHASMWAGSSETFVDLHPPGAVLSQALATTGALQGGYATFGSTSHAAIWSGAAESFVDLHPSGSSGSEIRGMSGDIQVGVSSGHAFLWTGTAESAVDLHSYVTGSYTGSAAHGVASDGTIVGLVSFGPGSTYTAAMWSPIPEPLSLQMLAAGVLTWAIATARHRGLRRMDGSLTPCRYRMRQPACCKKSG